MLQRRVFRLCKKSWSFLSWSERFFDRDSWWGNTGAKIYLKNLDFWVFFNQKNRLNENNFMKSFANDSFILTKISYFSEQVKVKQNICYRLQTILCESFANDSFKWFEIFSSERRNEFFELVNTGVFCSYDFKR